MNISSSGIEASDSPDMRLDDSPDMRPFCSLSSAHAIAAVTTSSACPRLRRLSRMDCCSRFWASGSSSLNISSSGIEASDAPDMRLDDAPDMRLFCFLSSAHAIAAVTTSSETCPRLCRLSRMDCCSPFCTSGSSLLIISSSGIEASDVPDMRLDDRLDDAPDRRLLRRIDNWGGRSFIETIWLVSSCSGVVDGIEGIDAPDKRLLRRIDNWGGRSFIETIWLVSSCSGVVDGIEGIDAPDRRLLRRVYDWGGTSFIETIGFVSSFPKFLRHVNSWGISSFGETIGVSSFSFSVVVGGIEDIDAPDILLPRRAYNCGGRSFTETLRVVAFGDSYNNSEASIHRMLHESLRWAATGDSSTNCFRMLPSKEAQREDCDELL